jgi:alkaline phosphatase
MRTNNYLITIVFFIAACFFIISCSDKTSEKPAKYIFYLIGDGMGLAQVSAAEEYLSELEGKKGGVRLNFTQFPVLGLASTYSASSSITCSAAAGTALATGSKTKNGMISMNPDSMPLNSIACKLREKGYRIGITSSVGINHATPAVFYAHQPHRDMYYEIGLELPESGFDFFAASSVLKHKGNNNRQTSLYNIIAEKGYGIARGAEQYDSVKNISKKMLLVAQPDTLETLAYAIDRKNGDLTLTNIVEKAISFLSEDNNNGFFLMIEGGKIDWASHSNDGGTAIRETMDFADAIDKVIDFYNAHPDETLIVITADHETGGMALGVNGYLLNTEIFKEQKISKDQLTTYLYDLFKNSNKPILWPNMKEILADKLGFWRNITISEQQEQELKSCYEKSLSANDSSAVRLLSKTAVKILNDIARIGWTTPDHTGIPVPVYAIGAGSSNFAGRIDNTDIPKKIMKAAGLEF